jgi:hypothetical protein
MAVAADQITGGLLKGALDGHEVVRAPSAGIWFTPASSLRLAAIPALNKPPVSSLTPDGVRELCLRQGAWALSGAFGVSREIVRR